MISMQPCRLTEPAQCQELVELALDTFGRVEVVFNLAGGIVLQLVGRRDR